MGLLDWQGQAAALGRLQAAMRNGRVHHCYLFHGPDGVGRTGIALDLARTLLCERPIMRDNGELSLPLNGPGERLRDYCGNCPSCRLSLAGTHPDLTLVTREPGKSTLSVEVLQERLLARAGLKSHSGRLKAFIVPEAERIAEAGWNKLLKTLEEPPPQMLTVLVAPSPNVVLPTILSRAQVVAFRPLPTEFVERLLMEHHGLPPGEAAFLARFTGGSPGESLRLAAIGLVRLKRELVTRLSELSEDTAFELADRVMESARAAAKTAEDSAALVPSADGTDDSEESNGAEAVPAGETVRRQLRRLLAVLAGFYRDVLLIQAGSAERLLLNADQIGQVRQAAAQLSKRAVLRAIGELASADVRISGHVLPGLGLEALMGELAVGRAAK